MSDLIPWYLVELRSRLSPFLDAKLVETIVGETKSHLSESVTRLEDQQKISEDQATTSAVATFGSPEKVALSHLREHAWRPFGIKPIWLVTGGALVSTTCWMLHWQWLGGYFDNFGAAWTNIFALAISFFATLVYALGCYAGRRRYRAVTFATCFAMVAIVPLLNCFLIVGSNAEHQGFNRLHLSRDIQTAKLERLRLLALDRYVQAGLAEFEIERSPADLPAEYRDSVSTVQLIGGFTSPQRAIEARVNEIRVEPLLGSSSDQHFVVPSENGGVYAMVDGRLYAGLREVATDYSHAKYFWRTRAPRFRDQIGAEDARLSSLLSAASEAQHGRIFFYDPAKYGDQVMGSIPTFFVLLLVVEAVTFAVMRTRRRRPEFVRA